MRRTLALVAVVIIATATGARAQSSGASEPGNIGIRLLDIPVERAADPRAQSYVIDHLNPGDVIERRVEVRNDTTESITLALYAASASVEGGEFHFGDDRAVNELTTWTTVTPGSLTIPAGRKATAEVTINVAPGATTGEHYGVVWAEARSAPSGAGITAVNRVGVRMYVSIGPGGEPPSDFEIRSLTAARDAEGRPFVKAEVENTGQRALDLSGNLQLDEGPGGLAAGPFAMELGTTLAPGETEPATVFLDPSLPAGPWHAVVTVRSGLLEKQADATITFPTERARSAAPVTARMIDTGGASLLEIGLSAGVILISGGGLFLILLARRRRRRGDEEDEEDGQINARRPLQARRPEPDPEDQPRRLRSRSARRGHLRQLEQEPVARARQPREPRGRESGAPVRPPRAGRRARPAR